MAPYLAYIKANLRLTAREKSAFFFVFIFPLIFFYIFAFANRAERGGVINGVFASIAVIGTLGNGLFGGGIRMLVEREAGILRRFKVAPISPLPILISSIVTGLITYAPSLLGIFFIAKYQFGMKTPERWLDLSVFMLVAIVAFRAIGLIVASVANNMAEGQILTQLLYFPMMFLSGATFPTSLFPKWLAKVSEFIPATHLGSAVQGILIQNLRLTDFLKELGALVLTTVVALFVCYKLFRWEKDEKVKPSSKLWVLASILPFFLIGAWQLRSEEGQRQRSLTERKLATSRTRLFKNARLIIGNGQVIERGSLLVRDGKIAEVFTGDAPAGLPADEIEAAGKTIIPGLIDAHVHLGSPGGIYADPKDYLKANQQERALAAYLYCGVTAVRSTGDWLDDSLAAQRKVMSNAYYGADLLTSGPLFTAEKGHPTQLVDYFPPQMRSQGRAQFIRAPKTADEARQMVRDLKKAGVNLIKGVLDEGEPGYPFERMKVELLQAAAAEARALGLPLAVHTSRAADVADAVRIGATSIEHGSMLEELPVELLKQAAAQGVFYDPTVSVIEAVELNRAGKMTLLELPLVQQAAPSSLLKATKAAWLTPEMQKMRAGISMSKMNLNVSLENLRRAHQSGLTLVAGTDAGNMPLVHGPAVHRELQLWVKAGIPPAVALQAATGNAAKLLGIEARTGTLEKGKEATLLVLEANPLEEIAATERISTILFKGERIIRADLLTQPDR